MTILVIGRTGTIGSQVLQRLVGQSAQIRALIRDDASESKVPAGVGPVLGDMTDVASMRTALKGVDTLFLLNAVAADEVTQALMTLAPRARGRHPEDRLFFGIQQRPVRRRTAFCRQVPGRTGHRRPGYSRHGAQAGLLHAERPDVSGCAKAGIYRWPIGDAGVAMVDIRDIADAVVAELLRREGALHPLPRTTIELVGPDTMTGTEIATIWASVLGRDVRYGGNDLATFESQAAGMMPGWMDHDIRLMLRAVHRFGMIPGKDSRATFEALIGHPLRSYRAFAEEAAANW
jgi:uncharacterized protein YbjT (DUF2867 family)